ncbi:MAG: ribonuclease H-like domain-containing protein [Ignavibacteria bacterium]|nr:ribonuclease H-like domain-containing protein [Ignavibacteria bacterium]
MQESYCAFDIETAPLDWSFFDETQHEYLLRGASTTEEQAKKKSEMALSPLTAQIVCLGIIVFERNSTGEFEEKKRTAYLQDNSLVDDEFTSEELANGAKLVRCNEKTILTNFWKQLRHNPALHLISFNGRGFDAPFMMMRSALHRVKPSRNLMDGTRFNYPKHTDLIDELCFFNASQTGATRRYNFDFFTKAFGINSPKSAGVDGSKVAELFQKGEGKVIAEYCLRDVQATWDLFLIWREYLAMK